VCVHELSTNLCRIHRLGRREHMLANHDLALNAITLKMPFPRSVVNESNRLIAPTDATMKLILPLDRNCSVGGSHATQTIHAFGGHRADREPAGSMSVIACVC
jgi:hypothetical protein